jgi:hypothetical protein
MAYYVLKESELDELNELSSSALGVIQKDSGTAMNPTARVLVIGLGGMGLRTVYELKKTLEDRIGKISDSSSHIRFLAIDTSKTELTQMVGTGVLSNKEVFLLHNDKIGAEIKKSLNPETRKLVSRSVESALPPPTAKFNPTLSGQGANQVRLAGRLSLMESGIFQELTTRIRDAIKGLSDFQNQTLEVYVAAGIGGGSGSGLVIDLPYIVRKILLDLGIGETHTRVFGYVYLPNIYDNGQVANLQNAYSNGYAALKEIDYYMNIDQIGETYNAVYPGWGDVSSSSPIFNVCTLVGGKCSIPIVTKDSKTAAVNCCVAALINQVTSAKAPKADADASTRESIADTFTGQAFMDNVTKCLQQVVTGSEVNFHHSGYYKYNCVGSAMLKFPSNAIVECFVGGVYEDMMTHLRERADAITQKDVDDFAKALISPEDFMRSTLGIFSSQIDAFFDETTWTKNTVASTIEVDNPLAQKMDKILAEFDNSGKLTSDAITAANVKADAIFKDPKRGPLFFAKLLTDSSRSGGKVTGYYERLEQYVQSVHARKTSAETFVSETTPKRVQLAKDMQGMFGFNKSKLASFQEMVKNIYLKKLEAKLCEKLAQEYYRSVNDRIGICYRMKQNLDTNYLYFADIMTRIGEILKNNVAACQKDLNPENAEDGNILAFREEECLKPLTNSVANTLTAKRRELSDEAIASFGGALAATMLDNKEAWLIAESGAKTFGMSEPAKAFRTFVKAYPPFADIINQTFSGYFEAAYRNEPDSEKNKVIHYLVNYLNNASAPMFNTWQDFGLSSVSQLCYQYMVIPNNMGEFWGKKFKDNIESICATGLGNNIYESPEQSAIYNYTMYAGMPMWLHADLINYEKAYYNDKTKGLHINEHESFRPTYKEYPALMPPEQWFHVNAQSNLKYENKGELTIAAEVKTLVNFCLENGVIHRDEYDERYVVSLIENRPPLDPKADTVKRFVASYCKKAENKDKKGMPKIGAHLYNAILDHYGRQEVAIAAVGILNVGPETEENLPLIIRKQMKLVALLRDIREYLKSENSIFSLVKVQVDGNEEREKLKEFNQFLFYGLVAPGERGVWSYRLGEKLWPITSKLEIATTIPELVPYMEMAVYETFKEKVESEDIERKHVDLLKKNVKAMGALIMSGDVTMESLMANYETYTKNADKQLDALVDKVSSGDTLEPEELRVKDFYEALKEDFESFKALFE